MNFCRSSWANHFPLMHHLVWWLSFGHVNMLTKVGVKERKLVVQSCSNLNLDRDGFGALLWTKTVWIDLKLWNTIIVCIYDSLEFSWIFMKIFPVEIFQILEMGRNGFGRFCPIFWSWPCVETHIYGKYMSIESP